jgi:hypothetical protein
MELDHLDQVASRGDTPSPFFVSSRAPAASPQSWELQDVDFLLPGPPATTARSYVQDSPRKYYCSSLHDSEFSLSPELGDATRPLAFRSELYWQEIALCEPVPSEYPPYFVDEGMLENFSTVSKTPTSMPNRTKLTPPMQLQVHAMACSDEDSSAACRSRCEGNVVLKNETSVVSPTMVDKKILVTDNDLRLFSARASFLGNMRALRAEEDKACSSPHSKREKAKSALTRSSSVGHPSKVQTKRHASCVIEALDHEARAFKRVKSSDQSFLCARSFDPRWYYGKTEGFHGMQPSLLTAANRAAQDCNGSSIYRSVQSQVSARLSLQQQKKQKPQLPPPYSPPTRKIGIYLPAERIERLRRFHEKRKHRVYTKRIKYDCRKRLANASPRVKGRFVRKSEFLQAKEKAPASPDSSGTTSSADDC